MIDNLIEEQWREFYLPYTFGELHSQQTKSSSADGSAASVRDIRNKTADTSDNPLEEEFYIQQNKYTTEEI